MQSFIVFIVLHIVTGVVIGTVSYFVGEGSFSYTEILILSLLFWMMWRFDDMEDRLLEKINNE